MKTPQHYLLATGAFVAIILLVWLVVVFTSQTDPAEPTFGEVFGPHDMEDTEGKSPTAPDEAMALRFFQTKDPATNTVPMERLWIANQAAEVSGRQPIANGILTNLMERGPSTIGGRTRAVLWDPDVPNKVWAGGVSGGLWFVNDITADGTSWVKTNDFWDNLAISTMAYDPTTSGASRTYYVGTGEGYFNADAVRGPGIFKSTDAGINWTLLPSTENASFTYVQKVIVTSTGVVLAATRDGVQRSTDGGTSWTKVLGAGVGSPSAGLLDAAADLEIAANGDIYAALSIVLQGCDGIYKSTNGGVNWTKQTLPGACDYERIEIAPSPSSADTVYAATQNISAASRSVNHIFKTTNGGTSWTALTPPPGTAPQAWYDLILSVNPADANNVYLGVTQLWRTTNGATSWSQIGGTGIHVDHHAIVYKPGSSEEVVFGNDGGVYYSANATSKSGGAVPTIVNRNDDYNVTQYYGGDIHPGSGSNIMIGGTQDNSTHRFSSPGIGPITSPSPLNCCDGSFAYIDQTNPTIMIGSIQNARYYRSTDGGLSFGSFGSPFLNAGGLFINPGDYDDTENVFYATRNLTQISRCHTMETSPSCSALTITGLNVAGSTYTVSPYSAAGTSTVYIGAQNGELFRVETTLNGSGVPTGQTITQLNTSGSMPSTNISSVAIGSSEQQLLVTFSNYGVNSVWETFNGGTTWFDRDDNATLPDMPINGAIYNPNNTQQVLLATEAGIWGTIDVTAAGPTWVRAADMPLVRVDQLQYRPSDGQVMIITHGRGIWTAQLDFSPATGTRYVALGGNDIGSCTDELNPCATVAYAVSQALNGETIEVAAGTYNEPGLLVDKDLDIVGAGVILQ